jgi:hypothetical protein
MELRDQKEQYLGGVARPCAAPLTKHEGGLNLVRRIGGFWRHASGWLRCHRHGAAPAWDVAWVRSDVRVRLKLR